MNKIVIDGKLFFGNSIRQLNASTGNSMIGAELSTDILSLVLEINNYDSFAPLGYNATITSDSKIFKPAKGLVPSDSLGQEVYWYDDDKLVGKYYLDEATDEFGSNRWYLSCISAMGFLERVTHNGGIYEAVQCGEIIDDIFSIISFERNVDYFVDGDVYASRVRNWLPRQSARDNLKQILLAVGASVLRRDDGALHITFNQQVSAESIDSDRIFLGVTRKTISNLSKASVIEHSYLKSDSVEDKVLFDNTSEPYAVTDHVIVFSEPIRLDNTLRAVPVSGGILSIDTSDHCENLIRVTGKGIVYGKPYVHTTRTLSWINPVQPYKANEVSITDAYLISSDNSENALLRLQNYYSNAVDIDFSIKLIDGKPKSGEQILFTDLYGEERTAYIKQSDIVASGINKASAIGVTGWQPKYVGNDFNDVIEITKDDLINGRYNVPSDLVGKKARIVLFNGGRGGFGGHQGERGTEGEYEYYGQYYPERPEKDQVVFTYHQPLGGAGGLGGDGGSGSDRLRMIDINSLGNSYSVVFGDGSMGTNSEAEASQGGPSSWGSDTTDDAFSIAFNGNYVDTINGKIYCGVGDSGIAGESGGNGGHEEWVRYVPGNVQAQYLAGSDGNDFEEWVGGTKGIPLASWEGTRDSVSSGFEGGGGGACKGSNGQNGGDAYWYEKGGLRYPHGGLGGDGGSVPIDLKPEQSVLGKGGTGGYGGGGGGAGGSAATPYQWECEGGAGGIGGLGGYGGQGSDGFALMYVRR